MLEKFTSTLIKTVLVNGKWYANIIRGNVWLIIDIRIIFNCYSKNEGK